MGISTISPPRWGRDCVGLLDVRLEIKVIPSYFHCSRVRSSISEQA